MKTPRLELIKAILPDVLVKGGDYKPEEIAGAKEVIANGGRVVINPILKGFSTTSIIAKMKGETEYQKFNTLPYLCPCLSLYIH